MNTNLVQILQNHTVWILKFASETADAWKKDDNDVYMLTEDFDKMRLYIKIYKKLPYSLRTIDTSTITKKNTYFKYSENI